MDQRQRLEHELRALLSPVTSDRRHFELRGDWTSERSFERAILSTPDQEESGAITVEALRFPGQGDQVALVVAGVHGTEPEGADAARELSQALEQAGARGVKPQFTTILVPALISRARNKGTRYVRVAGKDIEPNRNFPAPGEGYEYARERGRRRRDRAELLDCRGEKATGDKVRHRMLAETRILTQLIEREKPVRAASLHAHSVPGVRGDGPGIFVDPRGGFNEHTDAAFTAEGKLDDSLTRQMLGLGLTLVASKLPLTNDRGRALSHPFTGNLADATGKVRPGASSTVHYTSTKHPCGTSFGEWGPVADRANGRKGMSVITVEIPRYPGAAAARQEMIRIHATVLAKAFLGLP